jgi:hypothetical protein
MDQVYGTAGEVKKKTQLTSGLIRPGTRIKEKKGIESRS